MANRSRSRIDRFLRSARRRFATQLVTVLGVVLGSTTLFVLPAAALTYTSLSDVGGSVTIGSPSVDYGWNTLTMVISGPFGDYSGAGVPQQIDWTDDWGVFTCGGTSGYFHQDLGNGWSQYTWQCTAYVDGSRADQQEGVYINSSNVFSYNNTMYTVGSGQQIGTLSVNPIGPSWTSNPGGDTVSVGQNYGNGFSASGDPTPGFSESGGLPCGVGFSDNGNGSASIGGTPCGGTGGSYPITVYASNSGGTIGTGYTLTVLQAPAFTSSASATFTVGSYGAVGISANGYPGPSISESGALPPGLSFNGSALYGTPGAGAGGTWHPTFTASSSSGTVNQTFSLTVNPEGTSIAVSAAAGTVDQTTTVSATVSPTPDGGTVAFSDTAGFIRGCGAVPVSNGTASCNTAVLTASGSDTVYAQYEGDASYATSPEGSTTFAISAAPTSVAVAASPSNPAVNTDTTLTATLSPRPDGGTVAFSDAKGYVSGCGAVALQSGVATCLTGAVTSIATDAVTASYGGDANFKASAGNLSLSPVPGTPSIAVASSPGAATYGATATITATLAPAPGGGTVAFSDANGYITGCGAVAVAGTTATCLTGTFAAAGSDAITAHYSGDTNYNAISGGFMLTIDRASPLLVLSSSPQTPSVAGTATITATVAPAPGGGTVAFSDSAGYITGCSAVAATGSVATCVTATITSVEPDQISATYSGDANYTTASASLELMPVPATTAIGLSASPAVPDALSTTTITASVSPVPDGGTVAFSDAKGFITGCSAVAVNTTSGRASCVTTELTSVGLDEVTSTFSGNADYSSSDATLALTVAQAPTTTTVTASPSPVQVTSPTILTATISPIPDGGTVAFSDTEGAITTLDGCGAVPVNLSTGTASCETSSLPTVGTDDVTAIYSGDVTYAPSSDIASVTVGQVVESLAVTTSPSVAVTGAATTVEARLSPAPGGGTVAFSDSGGYLSGCGSVEVIGGAASCVMTTTPAATGTDVISVAYSGDTDYAPVSNAPGTTIEIDEVPVFTSSPTPTGTVGAVMAFPVTTAALPEVTNIAENGALPTGITYTGHSNGTATLSGTPGVGSGGIYPITLTATNGVTASGAQAATITIDAVPAFTSVPTASFTIGAPSDYPVDTTGFPAPSITESGSLPSGISVTDNGDGTASISGTAGTGTAGSWPITLTASNGVGAPLVQHVTIAVISATTTTVPTGGSSGGGSSGGGSSGSSGSSGTTSSTTGGGNTIGDTGGTGQSISAYTFRASLAGVGASSLSCVVSTSSIHPTAASGALSDLGLAFSCKDAGHTLRVSAAMTKTTVLDSVKVKSKLIRKTVTVWRGELQFSESWRHLTFILTPSSASMTSTLELSGRAAGYVERSGTRLTGRATLAWSLRPIETT